MVASGLRRQYLDVPSPQLTRRMDEKDRGQITGPKENDTGELPYVPDKRVDT